METRKKKYITLISVICVLCLGIGFLSAFGGAELEKNAFFARPTADAALNASFGALEDGMVYVRTDYSKAWQEDDTVGITVDRSQAHGTEQNPFVLRSKDDWAAFRTALTNNGANANKVFVLGGDLDFGGATITGADTMTSGGRLYGRGYSIKNVTISPNERTGYGGLISQTIGDVVISDVYFKNVNVSAIKSKIDGNAYVGTVVGIAFDTTDAIQMMNVHAEGGSVKVSGTSDVNNALGGGLIAKTLAQGNMVGGDVIIYKCGFTGTINADGAAITTRIAGIIVAVNGSIVSSESSAMIDGCYFNGTQTNGAANQKITGGISVLFSPHRKTVTMKNCYTRGQITMAQTGSGTRSEALISVNLTPNSQNLKTVTIENTYSYMSINGSQTLISGSLVSPTNHLNPTTTLKNNHYAGPYSSILNIPDNTYVVFGTNDKNEATLLTNAKSGLAGKLNVDNVTKNDAINYPVHGSKIGGYAIQYYSDLSGTETEVTGLTPTTYRAGEAVTLPTPSAGGKAVTFVGWTTDSLGSWDSACIKTQPKSVYGDQKLYAVWKMNDFTASVSADAEQIKYGGDPIVLTASGASKDFASNQMTFGYSWAEDGTAVSGSGANYATDNIGTHVYKATVRARLSASGRVRAEATAEKSVTVTKGDLMIPILPRYEGTPYIGMTADKLALKGSSAKNAAGADVTGTYGWRRGVTQLAAGDNVLTVDFTPTDTVHYNTASVELTITGVPIEIVFDLVGFGEQLRVPAEYNQNYSAAAIREMFVTEFNKNPQNIEDTIGKKPVFDHTGDITRLTESKTITVTFEEESYMVVFDFGYDNIKESKRVGYNNFVYPERTTEREGYRFDGWYREGVVHDALGLRKRPRDVGHDAVRQVDGAGADADGAGDLGRFQEDVHGFGDLRSYGFDRNGRVYGRCGRNS